jgi:pyroglutamyl-peptidase
VYEAEAVCGPAGAPEAEGWAAHPAATAAGVLCRRATDVLGVGSFVFNVRALTHEVGDDSTPVVVTLRVTSASGAELASGDFKPNAFPEPLGFTNLTLRFRVDRADPVTLEVTWPGERPVRVDYLEVFRPQQNLILGPASGVLAEGAALQIEMLDPLAYASFRPSCDGRDLSDALAAMLAAGTALVETTDFRMAITVPAAALLETCPLPTRLMVQAMSGASPRTTSRVTYRDAPPACAFAAGTTPVLLTGFEAFPADSTHDNSSERAVMGFDASALPGISVMPIILPVEYDSAPAWVADVIRRCQPAVVVSFGQGRWAVDLETTAYNRKDTSGVAGGVPDNRGVVQTGEPITTGGPAERPSTLPLERILPLLSAAGIAANLSDDPGRYICNDVFYATLEETASTGSPGGFVHLPRMERVGPEEQAQLQTVVATVVGEAIAQLPTPAQR